MICQNCGFDFNGEDLESQKEPGWEPTKNSYSSAQIVTLVCPKCKVRVGEPFPVLTGATLPDQSIRYDLLATNSKGEIE
mgnify:CR=1 FL=1